MANYPQVLAQDAVCQSHTGHMTGLWFLPARPIRLNTNDDLVTYSEDGGRKCVRNICSLIPDHMLYIAENESACLRSRIFVFVKETKFVRRMCEIEN